MKGQQRGPRRRQEDELAQHHTTTLRLFRSKLMPADITPERITTHIHADGRTYSVESYRNANGDIAHRLDSLTSNGTPSEPTAELPSEAGA